MEPLRRFVASWLGYLGAALLIVAIVWNGLVAIDRWESWLAGLLALVLFPLAIIGIPIIQLVDDEIPYQWAPAFAAVICLLLAFSRRKKEEDDD